MANLWRGPPLLEHVVNFELERRNVGSAGLGFTGSGPCTLVGGADGRPAYITGAVFRPVEDLNLPRRWCYKWPVTIGVIGDASLQPDRFTTDVVMVVHQ